MSIVLCPLHPALGTEVTGVALAAFGEPAIPVAWRRGSRAVLANGGDSEALLAALWSAADNPAHVYRHVWQDGHVAWNNLATLHRRDAFDDADHRTQIRSLDKRWAN